MGPAFCLVAGARLQELPIYTQSHFRWLLSDQWYPPGMSAFPESGRSDTPETAENRVRFRPEADVATPL